MLLLSTLCLVVLSLPSTFSEIYSSIQSVKDAWTREKVALQEAVDFLKGFDVTSFEAPYDIHSLDGFKRFVAETNETHLKYDDDEAMEAYLKHPINIYHFIKRCVDDWRFHTQHFIYMSNTKHVSGYMNTLVRMFEQDKLWPRAGDLTATSLGLIRLQRTYQFSFEEMASGLLINGIPSGVLTVEDMYNIALAGVDHWKPLSAVKWILAVSKRMRKGEVGGPNANSFAKVRLKLAEVFDKFGNYHMAARAVETLPKTDAEREFFKGLITYYKERNATNPSNDIVPHQLTDVDGIYERHCRGEIPEKPVNVTRHLRCFTKPSAVPYHHAKIEVLHIDPHIYMFHDVIYEDEQRKIKEAAKKTLERSIVAGGEGFSNIAEYRISQTAWLDPKMDHENVGGILPKVFKRVQQLSGLRVDDLDGKAGSENLQVLNYGIGGLYGPHEDFLRQYPDKKFYVGDETDKDMYALGDRFATWMFYLNDVDYGGATIFPIAGARVLPVKGSATLWYNLNRDGNPDTRTLHAGCPVAIGSKWIANIWFRYNQQAFSKRCLPDNQHRL